MDTPKSIYPIYGKLDYITEGSLLEAVGDNPILLISVRPNGQQNQNPQP